MTITITINTDNAAFRDEDGIFDRAEVARLLRSVTADHYAVRLDRPNTWNLRDLNGNTVGRVEVKED